MAAVDDVTSAGSGPMAAIEKTVIDGLKAQLWSWIKAHQNEVVYTHRFWVVGSVSLRWRDLYPVVSALIGPDPDYIM